MKKIIALLLAVIMVMGLATVVSAETKGDAKPDTANTFVKKYTVVKGTAPAETFDFGEATFVKFYDQYGAEVASDKVPATKPTITVGDAVFADALTATDTANVTVSVSDYENVTLGKYVYSITEVDQHTAGVTYNTKPMYLVVTISRDEESKQHYVAALHYETEDGKKTGELENVYNSGKLTVTKQITGNMADMEKDFEFTIVLTAPAGDTIKSELTINVGNAAAEKDTPNAATKTYTYSIGDGESIVIDNIPAGVTYTISEKNGDYKQTVTAGALTGDIAANDDDKVEVTNDLTKEIDTGIVMDSVPFIVMAVIAVIGLAAFTAKKRVQE